MVPRLTPSTEAYCMLGFRRCALPYIFRGDSSGDHGGTMLDTPDDPSAELDERLGRAVDVLTGLNYWP